MLIFIISYIVLHYGLFIETHFNALQLKNITVVEKFFFIKLNILFILYNAFSLNTCECPIYH